MIFRNLSAALLVSVGPIAIAVAISSGVVLAVDLNPAVLVTLAGDPGLATIAINAATPPVLIGILFLMLVYVFTFAWICMAWHRFVLLGERPGPVPAISGRPIWLYVGTTVLLAVLLLLLEYPLRLALGFAAALFVPTGTAFPVALSSALGLAVYAVLTYLWFRFAVVLPASAVGRPMTLGDGWSVSGRQGAAILGVVLILILFTFGIGTALALLTDRLFWLGFAGRIAFEWLKLMLGASILTTIYWVTVEQRRLR